MKSMERIEWTKDRVKELRLKMGWSSSDFARHLAVEVTTVHSLENGTFPNMESISSLLTLFWNQAENLSNEVLLSALAEQELEIMKANQLYQSDLLDKYFK